MRETVKDKLRGENFLLKTGTVLFLLGLLLFNAFEVLAADPCGISQFYPASSNNAALLNKNAELIGWGNFDILRSGERDFYVDLTFNTPLPEKTVLKVFLNGTELGTMRRYVIQVQERWYFDEFQTSRVVRVGDVITITNNGQPFLYGIFYRYIYNWAFAGGSIVAETGVCSYNDGYIYLPTHSQFPRRLMVYPSIFSNSTVTRITLNEASLIPGGVGAEIANIPIISAGVPPTPTSWRHTSGKNDNIVLTAAQYEQLRQGHLTINAFTESQPDGYSQIPLSIFFINSIGDFEGDGQADLAVFRPSDQTWYLLYSSNNQSQAVQFGLPTDKLVIGDYDHDGKTDITAFQVDNPDYQGLGIWKILNSTDNTTTTIQWGLNDDIPLSMDIDGNNTSDLAVFRPSNGTWYIHKMGDIIKPLNDTSQNVSRFRTIQWGMAGDKPLAGDFDADGSEEIAVFRPSEGNWYIYNDSEKTYRVLHWGMSGDIPIAKDFDGDAKADPAVYRPSNGTWYILSSLDGSLIARQFGLSDDLPVPADFDKDGVSDLAVYRPSNGTWYVMRSSDNSFFATQFGLSGDIPAMAQR